MSLDKAIKHGKEKRKLYTGVKAKDKTCRNHGSCPRCKKNRIIQQTKTHEAASEQIKNYKNMEKDSLIYE